MTLRLLQLAQFQSWSRLELALDARPCAIFGPNGAGKTNLLEALSMLAPGRGLRGIAAPDQARRMAGAGWRIRATTGDHDIEILTPPGQNRQVRIDDKAVPQTDLARVFRVIWLVPVMDRIWTDPPETRRRFLDRLTLSFSPDHAEHALSYDKAMRERNRLLRDQVSDAGWYRALEAKMGESGAAITRNRLSALDHIQAAQRLGSGAFPSARLSLLAGEGMADDPDPGSISLRLAAMRPRDLTVGRTLTGPHRADLGAIWGPQDMPAALASTGEQKALLLSLILANARAVADQTPLLLLDEVAAHLDADRRALLYDELIALSAQAFVTGTGAELFDTLQGRATFLSVTADAQGSRLDVLG